jgi:integrase
LDVCKLKFEHIYWATSIIKFEQSKTGKTIILPLLPDVGNAIIDYLRFGRPQSEEQHVFLMERPPFEHFSSSGVVTHIVQRAYQKAGIKIDGKRYSAHSLRHSLTLRMLQKNTTLPVISEVLGHQNTESTRYYLRIDINFMKHCILDVPQIQSSFYEQKGGAFYE